MSAIMCESTAGEWGDQCPDCGQQLPERPRALSSWKASRTTNIEAADSARRSKAASHWTGLTIVPRWKHSS